ncbi:hypothetical protein [Mesorhizobium sp.]|uniref:hypothetical protein n=1 Tax=Mesorhizobium sp. TaxID=1871066 RepID=UPI00257D9DF8|nr:hypothetical protein [Mesorhizobium sp.]
MISAKVKTMSGAASRFARADIVTKNMRHRDGGEELRQPLGGLEPRLLGTAAGLHHLVEHLRLPAQGVPAELLDRRGEIFDRQVGHQLPIVRLATGRRILFEGVDVSQGCGLKRFCLPTGGKVLMAANFTCSKVVSS